MALFFGSQALRSTLVLFTMGITFAETGFSVANFTSRFSTLRCSFGRERLVIFMRLLLHPQIYDWHGDGMNLQTSSTPAPGQSPGQNLTGNS